MIAGLLALVACVLLAPVGLLSLAAYRILQQSGYQPGVPGGALPSIKGSPGVADLYQHLITDPMANLGIPFDEVEFPTDDGATLRGWYVPGSIEATVGVVTVHSEWLDRRDFLRRLPWLHGAAYPVLMFDLREHGVSDGSGRGPTFGNRERADVSAAVRYMKHVRGLERVAVFGASLGGASAILAAAADPSIDIVIAESPFADFATMLAANAHLGWLPAPLARLLVAPIAWRVGWESVPAPIDVVDRLAPRPLLLMHGTADRLVPFQQSEQLYARAGEPKELWIAANAEHDALANRYGDEYFGRYANFLQRYLGEVEW